MVLLIGQSGLEKGVEESIRDLELDLQRYKEQLEHEPALDIREELKAKISKTEEEIEMLKKVDIPQGNILMSGLRNNIDEMGIMMDHEPNKEKRERIRQKQVECLSVLAAREKPIENLEDLNDAVDQIESDERLIQRWYSRDFDEVDLELLMKSDIIAFFDTADRQALEVAAQQMFTNDDAKALGRVKSQIFLDAELKWDEYQRDVEGNIEEFEAEKSELQKKLSEASPEEKQRIRSRLREVKSILRNLKDQIESGRSAWLHRERTRMEKASAPNVLSMVKPDTMNMLASRIREAQYIRMEQVQAYLKSEFEKLEDVYNKHKASFRPETQKDYEEELAYAKEVIVNQAQQDPKTIRQLGKNFEAARMALEGEGDMRGSVIEVQETAENRTEIEARVLSEYERLKTFSAKLTPEQKEQMLAISKSFLKKHGLSGDSKIAEKRLNGIGVLAGENVTMQIRDDKTGKATEEVPTNAVIAEFEALLENISELSNEELLAIDQDLKTFKRILDTADAKSAHDTIEELEWCSDAESIQETLEKNLGVEYLSNHRDPETKRVNGDPSKHVKIIPPSEFEDNYRSHTKKGNMVFHEEDDRWYILINESVFQNEVELENLRKQLIHELLHLEFEKHPDIKDQVRKQLISSDPEHWEKIRAAFVEKENGEGKRAPDGQPWKLDGSHDDDILSELFAMQNEIPGIWSKGSTPNDKLNNLLVGSNLASALGDLDKKTRKYQADANPKTRGYSTTEGDDDEDSGTDVSTLSKEEASYQQNDQSIQDIRERIKALKNSGYLDTIPGAEELVDAIADYNEGTASLNKDLRNDPSATVIAAAVTSRIGKVSGDLTELEDQVGKAARNAPNTEISFFRRLWLSTTFLSAEDFVQMGTDVYEFLQRRHKRKVADHAAKLGQALFGGTDLGREATARAQKAESEEVNEWKSRYENMDAWQLMDELKGIAKSINPNQDQLKAILRILADKGRLNWRDENLWIALNKLQSAVMLKPGDPLLLHNPVLLRQRLHRALGEVYDFDEFTSLERTNESKYKSEKGGYDTLHSSMQDKLDDRLDELLAQARAGEQVEPMLYESILEYAIKNGKCFAENVMFHIMCGMAEGILAPDRGLALGDHLNAWPAVDWFSTMNPPFSQADWKTYCKRHFGKSFRGGTIQASGYGDDFKNWYWTTVQNNKKVIDRVKKSVGERGWDHDWGRSIAPLGDARAAKKFLSGRSGQEETKITGVSNAYVGAVMWLEENAKNPTPESRQHFARIAGWIAMSEGMLDRTAYMEKSKDINTRADEALMSDVARESGVGRHGGENVRANRQRCKSFLRLIDANFFDMITGRDARDEAVKKQLGAAAKNYLIPKYPSIAAELAEVETIDQIYDNIDLIIGAMFESMPPERFQEILTVLAMAR